MALRFRRSIKLAPGLRLNMGKRGFGFSVGPRGASFTAGPSGVHGNLGLPGTGLSYRTSLPSGRPQAVPRGQMNVSISIKNDGRLMFASPDGVPLPSNVENTTKKEHAETIRAWLEGQCAEINDVLDACVNIHTRSPAPEANERFRPAEFSLPMPELPKERSPGLAARFLASKRAEVERENQEAVATYERNVAEWNKKKAEFLEAEQRRKVIFEKLRHTDPVVMDEYLSQVLQSLSWPGETNVTFELTGQGQTIFIDIDLPEIDDFPRRSATVAARGLRLNVKELSEKETRTNYARHVHGIGFRIAAVAFYSLPAVNQVVLSAYSQRPDKSTGGLRDEYLYSVRVLRSEWSRIDFGGLHRIDPIEALQCFEIRQLLTKTGELAPIEPFAPEGTSGTGLALAAG